MSLVDLKSNLKELKFRQFGQREPYVLKDINSTPESRFTLTSQIEKRLDDVQRLTKLLKDRPGLKFIANQGLLTLVESKGRPLKAAGNLATTLAGIIVQAGANGTGFRWSTDNILGSVYFKGIKTFLKSQVNIQDNKFINGQVQEGSSRNIKSELRDRQRPPHLYKKSLYYIDENVTESLIRGAKRKSIFTDVRYYPDNFDGKQATVRGSLRDFNLQIPSLLEQLGENVPIYLRNVKEEDKYLQGISNEFPSQTLIQDNLYEELGDRSDAFISYPSSTVKKIDEKNRPLKVDGKIRDDKRQKQGKTPTDPASGKVSISGTTGLPVNDLKSATTAAADIAQTYVSSSSTVLPNVFNPARPADTADSSKEDLYGPLVAIDRNILHYTVRKKEYDDESLDVKYGVRQLRTVPKEGSKYLPDTVNYHDLYEASRPEDIILFKFRPFGAGTTTSDLFFRAYLTSLKDDYTGNWNATQYVGRGESVFNYTGFSRSFSFNFKIASSTEEELRPLYRKLNHLVGTTAPFYSDTFMRGILVNISIGDYLSSVNGFITRAGVSWETNYPWEVRDKFLKVPHVLDVDISFSPIHSFVPEFGKAFIGPLDLVPDIQSTTKVDNSKSDEEKVDSNEQRQNTVLPSLSPLL
jgi:hypothetical protein